MRTIIDDVHSELASDRYQTWAALHAIDDGKVHMELAGKRRPTAGSPYARLIIEAIRVAQVATPPAPLPLTDLGRKVMFTAQNPEAALRLADHPGWKVALTADPGPEQKWDPVVRAAAPKFKQAGIPILVWGVQTQVGAERIRRLAAELGADGPPIFQAETPDQYDSAMLAGAQLLVGNPNAWTQAQRDDAIARGDSLGTLFEVYSNMGSPWPDRASSQNVPITCEVLGVGSWEGKPDLQLADYLPHTPAGVWSTISVYLAENMSDESWGLLP